MQSFDYGLSFDHDHDYRTYGSMNYTGIGPKNYFRRDASIREDICERLKWDPEVDASNISVDVSNGIVTLEGSVDSRHAKRRAEFISDHVTGVIDIHNRISIKSHLDTDDDKIITSGDDGLFSEEVIPH